MGNTNKEQEMYDRATLHATPREMATVVWWNLFNHKKRDKLHKCIINGIHWSIAYHLAKNYRGSKTNKRIN